MRHCHSLRPVPLPGLLIVLAAALVLAGCTPAAPTPTPEGPAPVPTFTATPAGSLASPTGAANVAAAVNSPLAALAATLPLATPAPTQPPSAETLLPQARQLHRWGDYANAAALFNQVQNDAAALAPLRREAAYDLARAYLADGKYGEALATLDQLDQALAADGASANQFAGKEQFLRAETLLGQGKQTEAIAAFWRFLDAYPWMNEAVQPRIADAYLAANDPAGAAAALRRAADAAGDNVTKAQLLERLARAQVDAGSYAAAVAAYDEILSFAQNAAYRAEQQYGAGQALSAAGDLPGAEQRWRAATQEAPQSRTAYLALVELVNRSAAFDLYQRGVIDLAAEAYEPAINAFQSYLQSVDPTDARVGSALHGLGLAQLGAQNYADALATFDRVIAEHPQCDCFSQAWLDKAQAQTDAGDSAGARRTYRTFAREHKEDPLAAEALWQSGRLALSDGNPVEAAVDLLALADAFPQSDRAPQALYALGIGAIDKKLFGQASQVLTRLQTNYADYRWDAVAYWLGRALAAQGNADAARSQWQALIDRAPDIYYGVLAAYATKAVALTGGAEFEQMAQVAGPAGRLASDDGTQAFAEQWLRTWITDTQGSLAELPQAVSADQDLAKGQLLLDLDQRGLALTPLARVFDRYKDDPRALYALSLEFARLGAYRLSLLSAARLLVLSKAKLVEDGPIFIQRLAYPQPFNDLIVREAQANQLDPLLYFSLIRQESLFEEGAQSAAAAQGLAQIVPDTGRWIAGQLGHPEYTNDIIYRPVINLRFGAYYLGWVRKYLDGNLVSALAGYNAGPGNAKSWRQSAGADDTLYLEKITFSEPRVYIQQVLGNLYHYTRLYGR